MSEPEEPQLSRQEQFAKEQAEQNEKLDTLHRELHPERYDRNGKPKR